MVVGVVSSQAFTAYDLPVEDKEGQSGVLHLHLSALYFTIRT